MTIYGVTPTGFGRKPLAVILAEIEANARQIFGAGLIQTPESPLGQLNGMMASIVSTAWDIGESAYQSYDPDQAEGVRLDILARMRILERMAGEADADFRQAITNQNRARIDLGDIARAVEAVDGVTWVRAYDNSTDTTDANGIPSHSITLAVLGGDDTAVASAMRPYIVPGVGSYGNTPINLTVNGYCRTVRFLRPTLVSVGLAVSVKVSNDSTGCPPPNASTIATALGNELKGASKPANGDDITLHMLRTAMAARFTNVEITAATASYPPATDPVALPAAVAFDHMATFDPANVAVTIV